MTLKATLHKNFLKLPIVLLLNIVLVLPVRESIAQLSLANTSTTYTENFNTLISSSTATWIDNSSLVNWYAARTGNGTTIIAGNGSSNAGGLYSYGTTASSDRALGSIGSSNAAAGNFAWGVRIKNNTGGPVSSLDISYTGEQWRDANTTAQTVTFWYQTSNTAITTFAANTIGFTSFTSLDFTSPTNLGTGTAGIDGNAGANRVTLTATLTVPLNAGDEIMLKWYDVDHTGNDQGLGIDDFSVKANAGAGCTPAQLAITAINGSNPVNSVIANQSFSVTVESRDAANSPCNVSLNTPISISLLTGNGLLTGILNGTLNSGTSTTTITGLLYNTVETGISLTVDDGPGGLSAGNSSVFRALGISEVILPQFIEGINGANNNRLPYAYRVSISGLNPNTTYRYLNQVDTLDGPPNSNGSGNCIFIHTTGDFTRTITPSLFTTGNYDSLTTDGTGSFTGWFVTEPTGDNRFTPDSIVNMVILLNNGAGGNAVVFRLRTTSGVTVKSIGTGSTQGTGIYSYTNGFPKNFVMLYDNTAGSGRPLTGTMLEDDNADNFPNYANFYAANVDFVPGAWGSFLPNTLPTGLQRIEQRSLTTGAIIGCPATNANGVWPSGVNTVNPNGGVNEIALDLTLDDPLSSPEATASNNGPQCEGGTIQLSSSGGTSYTWTGPVPYSSAQQNPVLTNVSLADGGVYTVTVSDANGCTSSATTLVTVSAVPLATAGNSGPVCAGENVNLSSSGGNTYSWVGPPSYSNGTQNPVLTGIALNMAGTYTVTVTGANLCTAMATTVVVVHAVPDLSPVGSLSNSCPATTVDLTAISVTDLNGTTGSLSYYTNLPDAHAASNPLTLLQAQNVALTGVYYIRKTTTSVPACFDVVSVIVFINSCSCTPPLLTETHINVSCNNGSDGSINLSVDSGTAPFVYAWSNGATTEDISSLAEGTYTVTVTDAQPCSAVFIIVITQPATLSIATTPVNITCNGGFNGSINIVASGGTPTYVYNWSTGSTLQNINGLGAGTYTVTVFDVNGCSKTASVELTQPTAISITPASVNVNCNDGNTGSITLTVTGGIPGYMYSWSNGLTIQNLSGLTAGDYTVTITDANSCNASSVISVTQPAAVFVNPAATNVSCFQGNNGSIFLSVSGGVQPYSYNWSTGASTSGINNLVAGSYTATVTDQNGCSTSIPVTVAQPSLLSLQISGGNLSCGNGSNGSADLTVSGGTPSYTYSWSNGAATEDVSGLTPGSYTVTVTDSQGCPATKSVILSSPPAIVISATGSPASCGQSNGSVALSVSGGTPLGTNTPGLIISEYTANPPGTDSPFEWVELVATKPIDFTVTPYSVIFANNGNATTKGWKQGLSITYGFNITTGSVNTGDVVYVGGSSMTPTGTKLRVINTGITGGDGGLGTANSAGVLGNGGANADAIGVFNLPIASLDSNTVPVDAVFFGTGIGGAAVNGGADGYQLPINDHYAGGKLQLGSFFGPEPTNGGFTLATGSFNVAGNIYSTLRIWTNAASFTDNASAVTLTNLPASPYSYAWSNGQTTQNLPAVAGGTYTVTVIDGNGCTATATAIVVSPNVVLNVTAGNVSCNGFGSAAASASGGEAPYTYVWNTGATTAVINGLITNTYTVTANDANGCSAVSGIQVTPPAVLNVTGTVSNPVCRGVASGSIVLSVIGGVQPYSYLWTGGVTTQNRSGLGIGSYTVTVTDFNGCSGSKIYTITQPASTLLINTSKTNVRCFGLNSGIAGVSPTGGTAPYSYIWNTNPVQTTASVSGLQADSYTATITDAIGCVKSVVIDITEPSDIVVIQTQTNVTFPAGNNGTATVSASGGTPGYTYSWNTIPVKTAATVTGLTAGTYKCTVTDSKLCPKKVTFVITEPSAKGLPTGQQSNPWKVIAYPNPTSGIVLVSFNNGYEEKFTLSLTDFTGRELYQNEGHAFTGKNEFIYDFTKVGKGIYFIKISASNKFSIVKIVIQ